MYEKYYIAGNGMKTMFQAEIVILISALLLFVPAFGVLLGLIGAVVGAIVSMVGLYSAGPAHPNFKNAFYFVVAGLVIGVVKNFMGSGALGTLLSVVSEVMSFAVTYLVCSAAAELLSCKGDHEQADRGQLIWKLYAGCTAVSIVCSVLAVIPVIGALAAVALVLAGIVSLVAGVLYLIFLYKASQSLLS